MSIDEKIDKALELLFGMEPTVSAIREAQKDAEARERVNDAKVTEHGVEIKNLKDRVDGLHGKLNEVKTVPAEQTRWASLVEFFAALPSYWHVAGGLLAGAASMLAVIWRHRP